MKVSLPYPTNGHFEIDLPLKKHRNLKQYLVLLIIIPIGIGLYFGIVEIEKMSDFREKAFEQKMNRLDDLQMQLRMNNLEISLDQWFMDFDNYDGDGCFVRELTIKNSISDGPVDYNSDEPIKWISKPDSKGSVKTCSPEYKLIMDWHYKKLGVNNGVEEQ